MQSIQTSHLFSLSSVKPLEGLLRYRKYCLEETAAVLKTGTERRERSPIDNSLLKPWGKIGDFEYLCCPTTGSLFLAELPSPVEWAKLLLTVSQYRRSPQAFHSDITQSRLENVFEPKREWIQNTLRLHGFKKPTILEAATPPSDFTPLLEKSGAFSEVFSVNEMTLMQKTEDLPSVDAAVLLESLDRVSDPLQLLKGVSKSLRPGGLLFVTALVSSGFDMMVLGPKNVYLYPPDRTNCFSLEGLKRLITGQGFELLEVSTPGILDVEVVRAHAQEDPALALSSFEKRLLDSDGETHKAFQAFLQESGMSSFARIVAKWVSHE